MGILLSKEINGIGRRYLASPIEPLKWVTDPKDAFVFDTPRWDYPHLFNMDGMESIEAPSDGW
jgi:hypothetical protein